MCRLEAAKLVVAWLLLPLARTVQTVHVFTLHWNASNPMFRIDNTDHIVDVNEGNLPWEYDQVNIICPVADYLSTGTRGAGGEKYIIYNVSKEEYESCRITNRDPRIVAVCNKPEDRLQFTITFRSFSPTPRGLEFRPGHDYYFISTSSAGDLHRRLGGSCSSHNMKVVFKVADNSKPAAGDPQRPPAPAVNVPRRPATPFDSSTAGLKTTTTVYGYNRRHHDKPAKGPRRKGHNEVVKQEASTMSGSGLSASSALWTLLAAAATLQLTARVTCLL